MSAWIVPEIVEICWTLSKLYLKHYWSHFFLDTVYVIHLHTAGLGLGPNHISSIAALRFVHIVNGTLCRINTLIKLEMFTPVTGCVAMHCLALRCRAVPRCTALHSAPHHKASRVAKKMPLSWTAHNLQNVSSMQIAGLGTRGTGTCGTGTILLFFLIFCDMNVERKFSLRLYVI